MRKAVSLRRKMAATIVNVVAEIITFAPPIPVLH
jgi:hypothetical protein